MDDSTGMLSSVLPGVREFRTPLTVGSAWLLVVWLLFGHHAPRMKPDEQPMASLWDLGSYAGKGGMLIGASLLAYLVGAFIEIDPLHMWEHGGRPRWINRLRNLFRKGRLNSIQFYPVSDQTTTDLVNYAAEEYHARTVENPHVYLPGGIMREERQLATRLQAANIELFNRYDRLLGEASFRVNIAPPLLALSLALTWGWNGDVWLRIGITTASVAISALFFRQGVRRAIQSRDIIVQAVVADVVKSRFLARLERDEIQESARPLPSPLASPQRPLDSLNVDEGVGTLLSTRCHATEPADAGKPVATTELTVQP